MKKKILVFALSILLSILPAAAYAGTAATPPQYNATQCAQNLQQFQQAYQGQPQSYITQQFNLAFPSCSNTPTQKSQGEQNFADLTINMLKNVETSVQSAAITIGKFLTIIFLSVAGIKIMAGDGLKLAEIVKVLATYGVLAGLIVDGNVFLQAIFNEGIKIGQQISSSSINNIKGSIMQAGPIQGVPPALIVQAIPGAVGTDVGSVLNNTWSTFTNIIANIYKSMSPVGNGATIAGLIAVFMSLPSLLIGMLLLLAFLIVAIIIILETMFIHVDSDILVAFAPLVFALAIAEPYRSLVPNLISAVLKLALKNAVLYVMLGLYYVVLGVTATAIISDRPANMLILGVFVLIYGFIVWHSPRVVDGLFPGSPPSGAKAFGMAALELGSAVVMGAATGGAGALAGGAGAAGALGGALKGGAQAGGRHLAKKAGVNVPGGGPSAGKQGGKDDKHGAEIAKNSSTVSSGWEKADNIPGPSQAASLSKVDMGGGKTQEVVAPPPTQFAPSSGPSTPSSVSSSGPSVSSSGPSVSSSAPSAPSAAPKNNSSQQPSSSPQQPPSDNKKGQ